MDLFLLRQFLDQHNDMAMGIALTILTLEIVFLNLGIQSKGYRREAVLIFEAVGVFFMLIFGVLGTLLYIGGYEKAATTYWFSSTCFGSSFGGVSRMVHTLGKKDR